MKLYLHYANLEQLKSSYHDLFNIKDINELKNILKTLEYENQYVSIEYLTQYESIAILKNDNFFGSSIASNVYGFYIGNDTCEHLIFSLKEFEEIYNYISNDLNKGPNSSKKKTISLVTPSCGDYGLKKLKILFDYLNEKNHKTEIIINDIGVLNMIKEKYSEKLIPVLGRMLNKKQRNPMIGNNPDPQIPSKLGKEIYEKIKNFQKKYYDANPLSVDYFYNSYKNLGINRFGVDFIGNAINVDNEKIKELDIYFPYASIAHGRNCATRGIIEKSGEYYVQDKVCSRYCQKYDIFLGDGTHKKGITQRGNGVWQKHTNINEIEDNIRLSKNNRLIFSPFIPV